jgi:hypothetical protein
MKGTKLSPSDRLLAGMNHGSVNTSGYCQARQRLPQDMVSTLAQQSGALLGEQTLQEWLWQGRHVKLVRERVLGIPAGVQSDPAADGRGGIAS